MVVSGAEIDLRIATTPTMHGESAAVRLLRKGSGLVTLDDLGLSARDEAVLRDAESRMQALLQRPDLRTQAISILDIKNLGYELGRRLAAENFADQPTQIDYSTLKSKLCTPGLKSGGLSRTISA